MQEIKAPSYKLNKKIKDDTFSVDNIADYCLSLQISPNLFRVCVTDSMRNRCLLLEDYQFNHIQDADQLIALLNDIYDDHHLLQAGYWKNVKLALKTPNFSVVPNELFDQEFAKDYLSLNCSILSDSSDEVLYYKQHSVDAVNIFSVNKKIISFFEAAYLGKKLKVVHHTSSLIEGIMVQHTSKNLKEMYVFVEKDQLTVVLKTNRNLEFCNTFYFTTPEDFVYYVMFVAEQMKFNPEKDEVIVWGDLMPDSPLLKKLRLYMCHIKFGNKPNSLYFGYNFDELMDHNFFDLYNLHLCE
ncbi:MAG: DUF3822 family protein [Cytophagales bacterium]|nr:MAG: DUF3822 family protein [Cytophagales bacterium]